MLLRLPTIPRALAVWQGRPKTASQPACIHLGCVAADRSPITRVMAPPIFNSSRARLIAPALRHRLTSIWEAAIFVRDGGLLSYGPSLRPFFHRELSNYSITSSAREMSETGIVSDCALAALRLTASSNRTGIRTGISEAGSPFRILPTYSPNWRVNPSAIVP